MENNELSARLRIAIAKLPELRSFTMRTEAEVSALKGLLKVPLTGFLVSDNENHRFFSKADITLLNLSFNGTYRNENGNVIGSLNGKRDEFRDLPVDMKAIVNDLFSFFDSECEEITEDTEGFLELKIKEDSVHEMFRIFHFDSSPIDKYLKNIRFAKVRIRIEEEELKEIIAVLTANLEGLQLQISVPVNVTDPDCSVYPEIS